MNSRRPLPELGAIMEEMHVESAADWLGLSNQQRDMQVGVPRTGWDSRTWQVGSNK